MVKRSVPADAAAGRQLPAKLAQRRMSRVIDRERLFAWLDAQGECPLLWITGPAGAGKTTLVSTWLARDSHPAVWYRVDAGDGEAATVFSHLAMAASAHSRKQRLQLPALTPEYLLDLPGFARRFFGLFFAALPARCTLVFDSLEAAPGDALTRLLAWALDEVLPGQRVIVTSREAAPPALAHRVARGELATLGWDELRLTADEALAIALPTLAQGNDDEARRLNQLCDGWAAGYVLMLNVRKRVGSLDAALATLADGELHEPLFAYYLNQLFERASPATQRLLMHSALLSAFSAADAAALTPDGDASALLQALYRRHFFIERSAETPPRYRYHALFREFLLQQGRQRLGAEACRSLQRQAAALLQAQGRVEEALALWLQAQAWDEATHLVCDLAPALLVQGRHAMLAQTIDALPSDWVGTHAWLAYWRGMAALPASPTRARHALESAFAAFQRAGERVGCVMACSSILESFMMESNDLHAADPWGDVLRGLLFDAAELPLRVEVRALASTVVLAHRGHHQAELGHRAHRRALELMPGLSDPQHRLVAAAFCTTMHNYMGQWQGARRFIADIDASLRDATVSPLQRVMWQSMRISPATFNGEFESARDHVAATRAMAAETHIRVFDVFAEGAGVVAALQLGDTAGAEAHLARQKAALRPGRLLDLGNVEAQTALILLARGDPAAACEFCRSAIDRASAAGSELFVAFGRTVLALALVEVGDFAQALLQAERVIEFARASSRAFFEYGALMARAWCHCRSGRQEEMLGVLRQALTLGRVRGWPVVFPWVPAALLQQLGMVALRAGIEADHVRLLLRTRRIAPPGPDADEWPWPIRVSVLGPFSLRLDEQPIPLPAKAPKKPLELLKLLAAFGGTGLTLATIEQHLWPDLDGAAARNACNVTLHRLRRLLGDDEALRLHEGRLSLDPARVWTDVASFARQTESADLDPQRLLSVYRSPLLPDLDAGWVLAPRERLRSRFLRSIGPVVQRLEDFGHNESAAQLYRRVIEIDPAAEACHQGLIRCLLALGRRAEALDAWQRCSDQLYHERGLRPPPPLLALRRQIEMA